MVAAAAAPLYRHPLLRAALTSGLAMSAGDALCQVIRARGLGKEIKCARLRARSPAHLLPLHRHPPSPPGQPDDNSPPLPETILQAGPAADAPVWCGGNHSPRPVLLPRLPLARLAFWRRRTHPSFGHR